MNTEFRYADISLTLQRWPLQQANKSLQAWDAADELLLTEAFTAIAQFRQHNSSLPRLCIINDSFGALSCVLAEMPQVQISDSWLAQQATLFNLTANSLTTEQLIQQSSLVPYPDKPDIVLLKLPANQSYLTDILQHLAEVVTPATVILAAAKAKDINRNILSLFQRILGPASASLAVKKCRVIRCRFQPETAEKSIVSFPLRWPLEETSYALVNHANTFSREKLDIGARFFLQHLPTVTTTDKVIDLGCGNGVIGLAILAAQPEAQLCFCDESYMAVASARQTIAENLPDRLTHCSFVVDDCLSQQKAGDADIILCNPPFHQQQAITTHIARQMFIDAKRVLKAKGRLRIVANRHLDYFDQLTRIFGNCRHIASNPKFIILEAVKRN